MASSRTGEPSPAQVDLAHRLRAQKFIPAELAAKVDHLIDAGLTRATVRTVIDALIGLPGQPTPKQADLALRLRAEKVIAQDLAAEVDQLIAAGLNNFTVRTVIDSLIDLPDVPQPAGDDKGPLPVVPDGRYALGTVEDHTLYKVKTSRRGRVYIDRIEANEHMVELPWGEVREVLGLIAAAPAAAAVLYGTVTGRCYRAGCDKLLTDKRSLEAKAGKTCAGYLGIPWGPKARAAAAAATQPAKAPVVDEDTHALFDLADL